MSNSLQLHKAILKYFEDKLQSYKDNRNDEYYKQYEKQCNSQTEYEKEIIKSCKMCGSSKNAERISGIDMVTLQNKLSNEFYEPSLMSTMRCIVNLVLSKTDEEDSFTEERRRIHEFIRDPIKFGNDSVNGYAFITKMGDRPRKLSSGILVVKCPQNTANSRELIHEGAICLAGLNDLRKDGIYNFSQVYDVEQSCSGPILASGTNSVISWCQSKEHPVAYAFYENIGNAKSFKSCLVGMSVDHFAKYLMQRFLASSYASKKYGYTHGDDHTENELIRMLPYEYQLKYPYKGTHVYVHSPGGLVTTIDYGTARIDVNGVSLGISDPSGFFSTVDVYRDRSFVLSDAYKLFCFCMLECLYIGNNEELMKDADIRQKNNELYNFGYQIMKYFYYPDLTTEDYQTIILEQAPQAEGKGTFYFLPMNEIFTEHRSIDGLIDHICSLFTVGSLLHSSPIEGFPVLGCKDICKTEVIVKKEIGFGITENPTFFEVYDVYVSKNEKDLRQIKENLLRNFNQAYDSFLYEVNEILNFEIVPYYPIGTVQEFSEYKELHVKGLDNVLRSYVNYSSAKELKKYAQYIITFSSKEWTDKIEDLLKQLSTKMTILKEQYSEKYVFIANDIETLKSFKEYNVSYYITEYEKIYKEMS